MKLSRLTHKFVARMTDWIIKLFIEILNIGVETCWEGKVMSLVL